LPYSSKKKFTLEKTTLLVGGGGREGDTSAFDASVMGTPGLFHEAKFRVKTEGAIEKLRKKEPLTNGRESTSMTSL